MNSVVVDASPIIILSKIHQLNLLTLLYKTIIVPDQVMLEIQQGAKSKNEFEVLRNAPFSIVSVTIDPRVSSWDLGVGESQVISYSLAHKKCRPILDDAEAKNCCFSNGLTPLGTGTILILAKNAGLVPAIRPILNDMRENGYWIAPAVIDMLCKKVSE